VKTNRFDNLSCLAKTKKQKKKQKTKQKRKKRKTNTNKLASYELSIHLLTSTILLL